MRASLGLALVVAIAGCAGAGPGAKTSPRADNGPGESLVGLMESLAEDVEASGVSCDRFATLVRSWVERERDSIESLVDDLEQRVGGMTEEEISGLDERLTTAFEVIVHRASECGDHRDAQRALAEFDAVIEGS